MKNDEKAKLIADQCKPCSDDFYSGMYQGVKIALDAEKAKEISQLSVMDRMVKDNNRGICLSTTIVNAKPVTQGMVVGFGLVDEIGKDAQIQTLGLAGEYMFMCFAVKRSEFEKTKASILSE